MTNTQEITRGNWTEEDHIFYKMELEACDMEKAWRDRTLAQYVKTFSREVIYTNNIIVTGVELTRTIGDHIIIIDTQMRTITGMGAWFTKADGIKVRARLEGDICAAITDLYR